MSRFPRRIICGLSLLAGCHDLASFTTSPGESYEGVIVPAEFVRTGIDAGTHFCLTLDGDRLQLAPGTLKSSDGYFANVPLRVIPQLWNDSLSMLQFGQGRTRNLIYVATASPPGQPPVDAVIVVSLMESGDVELRMIQGAPPAVGFDAGPPATSPLYGLVQLLRQDTPCSF